jgi:uncharacterized protein YdiU (UPF0061 family)
MKRLTLTTDFLALASKFYTVSSSIPLENPKLASVNVALAKELGLSEQALTSREFVEFMNGTFQAKGSIPHAMAYAGHQFGYFVPNLGDGRALNLGKLHNCHLQLKGAGKTAYSRDADGRAVLRSSIREYLMSEAMHALGIPTTRALGILSSDTSVFREREERGSIVLRAASSWIRFGSFEFSYLGQHKKESVTLLADFVLQESYPHLKEQQNCYTELFFEVVDKTIELIAHWQSVGFMHGVMNTDNMSIAGLTLDYGPFAFMERFDKSKVCNTSDYDGRYSFENQPFMAQWNLLMLAKAFSPIAEQKHLEEYANLFMTKYKKRYLQLMSQKLGLDTKEEGDGALVAELLSVLQKYEIDYTPFFYKLSHARFDEIIATNAEAPELKAWLEKYEKRVLNQELQERERLERMQKINPKYVLKNSMLQEVIELAEQGDFSLLESMLQIAQNPFAEHKEFERYALSLPKELSEIRCSCSS